MVNLVPLDKMILVMSYPSIKLEWPERVVRGEILGTKLVELSARRLTFPQDIARNKLIKLVTCIRKNSNSIHSINYQEIVSIKYLSKSLKQKTQINNPNT